MEWDSSGTIYSLYKAEIFKKHGIPVVYVKTEKEAILNSFSKKEKFCVIFKDKVLTVNFTKQKLKEVFKFVNTQNFDILYLTPSLKYSGVCVKKGNFYSSEFNTSGVMLYSRDYISKLEKDFTAESKVNYCYYPGLFYTNLEIVERLLELYTYNVNFNLFNFLLLLLIGIIILYFIDPVKKLLYLLLLITILLTIIIYKDSF